MAYDLAPRVPSSLSRPLSEVVEQTTDNTPEVYAEIQARFEGSESIAGAAKRLDDADFAAFVELYEEAGE